MDKVKKPRGLIRYDSFDGISKGEKLTLTFRNVGYTIVLLILMAFFFGLLLTRTDVETTILRSYGTLYQEAGNNQYTNLYSVKVLNKTFDDMNIRLELAEPEGSLNMVGSGLSMGGQDKAEGAFFVQLDGQLLSGTETKIKINVFTGERLLETVKTSFMGPRK
jgi:hypothetical protein